MENEVQKVEPSAFVEKAKESWSQVLPKVCTPDRFAQVALSCLKGNEKLIQALQSREGQVSLAKAFKTCAELGIEPDGRRAYLIPFKNEIQLIIDYKGIAELAMRSGFVANIHADKVCENDEFEYNIGNIEKHRIDFHKKRGDAYAYYAIVTFKDGTKKCEVMSKDEIDAIKVRSAAWAAWIKWKKVCPWNTDYDEMAKKTVFKRLAKWIPQSPELRQAVEFDDEDYRNTSVPIPAEWTTPSEDLSKYDALDLDTPPEDENLPTESEDELDKDKVSE